MYLGAAGEGLVLALNRRSSRANLSKMARVLPGVKPGRALQSLQQALRASPSAGDILHKRWGAEVAQSVQSQWVIICRRAVALPLRLPLRLTGCGVDTHTSTVP